MPSFFAQRAFPVVLSIVMCGVSWSYHQQAYAADKTENVSFHKLYQNTKITEMMTDPRVGASLMRNMGNHLSGGKEAKLPHGFTPAPLPNDDMSAPTARQDNTDPYVKPQFYHRRIVNANGMQTNAHDDENRRGRGDLSGGVALTVPLSQ